MWLMSRLEAGLNSNMAYLLDSNTLFFALYIYLIAL